MPKSHPETASRLASFSQFPSEQGKVGTKFHAEPSIIKRSGIEHELSFSVRAQS
ncbi:hypothetical protein D052_0945 [Vibrio parahaemolyticus 10290]|nr:hypothetical protein D052_0945 [Vibrio parahaemolyticus 10290]